MGSHSSSEANIAKDNNQQNKSSPPIEMMHLSQNNLTDNFNNSNSSSINKDIMTDSRSISGRSTTSDKTIDKKSETQSPIPDCKITTIFEWNEGGESVFITGSFCGWSQQFAMNKTQKGNYELRLDLPKGLYQYKFIIDGIWRYSKFHPFMTDNIDNTNNYIDNTRYASAVIDSRKVDCNQGISKQSSYKIPICYTSDIYLSKNQLNTDAPVIPFQYSKLINLNYNSNQSYIGNSMYIERKIICSTEDTALITISHPSHTVLNHLFTKIKKRRYIKFCGTLRVRAKFSTFIYIKPLISPKCM